MSGHLLVLDPGLGNTVQDLGRNGYRHWGVPFSGALDPFWAIAANTLLGNPSEAAVLELRLLGPRLQAKGGAVPVAIVGNVTATLEHPGAAPQTLPGWCALTLHEGESLRLGTVQGLAYLAVAGGIAVPPALGSRSTYERTVMGEVAGRALRAGDCLPCGGAGATTASEPQTGCPPDTTHEPHAVARRGLPLADDVGPIRVLLGPQDDHFLPEAIATFLGAAWQITPERDRMGMRLAGPLLTHRTPAHAEILSDGVTPGAIQVPANGQPIVLLADAQTVGGYPKIATVIRADLGRLARWPADTPLRFAAVTLAEAHKALRARHEALSAWCRTLRTWQPPARLDLERLYHENLISGVVDLRAEFPP